MHVHERRFVRESTNRYPTAIAVMLLLRLPSRQMDAIESHRAESAYLDYFTHFELLFSARMDGDLRGRTC